MHRNIRAVLFLLTMLVSGPAAAATLSVSPVSFDIIAPRNTAKLNVENRGEDPVAVQIRVFRWEKKDGKDSLIPTKDVVASPPFAKLKAKGKYTVRIVRLTKRPIGAEESYRLLVDQLPKPVKRPGSRVSFLIRQSIPVFFSARPSLKASLEWSARIEGRELILIAENKGLRRSKLSNIRLRSSTGASDAAGQGATGYVLAGSTAQWMQPIPKGLAPGAKIIILAQDEHGAIEATVAVAAAD
jgi:fimbrial chaperone protein